METKKKYHQIIFRDSQFEAKDLVNSIIGNTELEVFSRNILDDYKNNMANQITAAEEESIEQIKSNNPFKSYISPQDTKPIRNVYDAIRPYSARIQPAKRAETQSINQQAHNSNRTSQGKNYQSFKSVKSFKSNANIKGKLDSKSISQKYKSKLIPLKINEEAEQSDKVIEQLRKNKIKAEEYERSKQNFLRSILQENEDYLKRQIKFASTMTKKQYTYSNNCQIIEISKSKQSLKKKSSNTLKNAIGTIPKINGEEEQKPQSILIQFAKKQPISELKQFIFNANTEMKLQNICPTNTFTTKFSVITQDL